jgi:hypothetical protein
MHRIFAVALMALATPTLANGVITEFPGSGLVFKEAADIAIAREDLYVSREKITVHYDYMSDAAATQTVTIGFPMPPVPINGDPDDPAMLPELEGKDLLNYMQFSASVNGEPVDTTLHQFAWLNGEDITARLAVLGIPAYLPYDQIEETFSKIDKATVDDMVEAGVISADDERTYIVSNWLYQSVYEWQQDFAPGETKVDIAYSPLAGYPSDFGTHYEDDPEGRYCVDDKLRKTIADFRDKNIGGYEVATVGYITTTATYWKGPIGEFNLTIGKDPIDVENQQVGAETAFCGKPDFKETETAYTWTARDFVPEKDISIVYYFFYDWDWDEQEPEIVDEPGVLDDLQRQ